MQLIVNGQPKTVDRPRTVRQLLVDLDLADAAAVAVEVNRQLVPHRQHESTLLAEGDRLEIVTLVGGG
jgi:sulfur carrier protein